MEKPRSSVFLAVSRCGPGQPSCVLGACSSWWRPSDKAAPDPTLSWFCQHPPVKVPSSKQWLSHFLELMAGILPSQTVGSFGDLGVHMQTSILQLLPWGHFRETRLYLSHWHCSPVYMRKPDGMMEGNQPVHLTVLRDPNCQLCPQGSSVNVSEHQDPCATRRLPRPALAWRVSGTWVMRSYSL